ncbi:hypothetical protein [Pedobacter cryoconitis]|uniref:Lipoprotein n=1 Tax=Pedobacter cryoconitis TaxID=188932 RepID=A0A327SQ69_9SPHI|nr:hypothetical protein [Pedobacter cryoconitis]RAJ31019.1 hypothetical protein LY11_02248 [Pedobacter cryoconitis]
MKKLVPIATMFIALFFASCNNMINTSIDMDSPFETVTVKNEYEIKVPAGITEVAPEEAWYSYEGKDETKTFIIKGETIKKEGYEKRRTEEGTLNKFPYGLKGCTDYNFDFYSKQAKDAKETTVVIDTIINSYPAKVYKFSAKALAVDMQIMAAYLEGKDKRIQRIIVAYPVTAVNGAKAAEKIIYSFKSL